LRDRLDLTQTASEFIDCLVKREMQKKAQLDREQMGIKKPVAEERGCTTKSSGNAKHARGNGFGPEHSHREARSTDRAIDHRVWKNKVFNSRDSGKHLSLRQKEEATEPQRLVDQALLKIEAWAEDWLAGQLGTDEDWSSFENCLDRPDL
jgi:hypothetical protein